MSLSDCEKCWNTPCTCGYEYDQWNLESLESFHAMIGKILEQRRAGQPPLKSYLFAKNAKEREEIFAEERRRGWRK